LLKKLTDAIAPAIASSNPSPITGKDPILLSAHSLSDRHEFSPSFTHPLGNELFSPDNHDFDHNVNHIDD
jgi:acid phosphatase class B